MSPPRNTPAVPPAGAAARVPEWTWKCSLLGCGRLRCARDSEVDISVTAKEEGPVGHSTGEPFTMPNGSIAQLRWQSEQREQPVGVEEEVQPADRGAVEFQHRDRPGREDPGLVGGFVLTEGRQSV